MSWNKDPQRSRRVCAAAKGHEFAHQSRLMRHSSGQKIDAMRTRADGRSWCGPARGGPHGQTVKELVE